MSAFDPYVYNETMYTLYLFGDGEGLNFLGYRQDRSVANYT